MSRLLVHVTRGPEDPTVSALALLVARTAADGGHEVVVFLAGDAALLMLEAGRRDLVGKGTGSVQEHLDALAAADSRIWVSGMSAAARGVTEEDLAPFGARFATPDVLVRESLDSDRQFTY